MKAGNKTNTIGIIISKLSKKLDEMISDEAKIKPIVPKIVNIKKKNDVLRRTSTNVTRIEILINLNLHYLIQNRYFLIQQLNHQCLYND